MNDVYGEVSDWRRLLPRERDVITGRRSGHRDDKHHQEQSPGRSRSMGHRTRRRLPRAGLALVAALALGTVGALGARAWLSGDGPSATTARPSSSPTGTVPVAPPPSLSGTAATAILVEYSGGELVRHECSDASGGGACVYYDDDYEPLVVRCTPSGCTLRYVAGTTGSLAGPLTLSGTTNAAAEGCEETRWTLELTPVGEAVTEGIRHPARLVGTATASRPAEVLPNVNCLGAEDVYRYDATP
jgi:hypothetical protein